MKKCYRAISKYYHLDHDETETIDENIYIFFFLKVEDNILKDYIKMTDDKIIAKRKKTERINNNVQTPYT